VQAQVLNLFMDARDRGLGCVFISHDLAVIRHIADRVLVLQDGRVAEQGVAALLDSPSHPFTAELVAAQPRKLARAW
jgi:peptide/nickel transport system ATP-binding protein